MNFCRGFGPCVSLCTRPIVKILEGEELEGFPSFGTKVYRQPCAAEFFGFVGA